jgi:MFS family permease
MLTHTAMTAMGRWFNRKRGRAVSIAGLGLPASEGLLPPLAVASVALLGWRETWLAAAALLLLVALPVFVVLLAHERHPTRGPMRADTEDTESRRRHWSRAEVLGSPLFYALLSAVLAPPFIMTAVFFNQVTIAAAKNWTLTAFAASFPLLAVTHVVSALTSGWLIDRVGARSLLPTFLLPLGLATLLLALIDAVYVLPIAMILIGATLGGASATSGALWAELYGTAHLGAIRATTTATVVLATAVAPGLVGVLLDAGVALEPQLLVMGAYCFATGLWMAALLPKLNRLAAA